MHNIFKKILRKISPRKEGELIFRRLKILDSYDDFKKFFQFDETKNVEDIDDDSFACDFVYQCLLRNDFNKVLCYISGNKTAFFQFDDEEYGICELTVRKHGMYTIFKMFESDIRYDLNFLGDIEKTHPLLAKEIKLIVEFLK